jgi:hypothetical protein
VLKPLPERFACVITRGALPILVNWNGCEALLPTPTLPRLVDEGVTLSAGCEACPAGAFCEGLPATPAQPDIAAIAASAKPNKAKLRPPLGLRRVICPTIGGPHRRYLTCDRRFICLQSGLEQPHAQLARRSDVDQGWPVRGSKSWGRVEISFDHIFWGGPSISVAPPKGKTCAESGGTPGKA